MTPKFLGGDEPDVAGKDRRVVLAKWLASPENPCFATNFANRVWAHFFGTGIVEPVDDVRVSNPRVEPGAARRAGQAVHRLQVRLQEAGPRHLQLADLPAVDAARTRATRATTRNFAHATVRRIKAETLLDTISAGDRHEGQVPGPAARRPGRADRRRPDARPTS